MSAYEPPGHRTWVTPATFIRCSYVDSPDPESPVHVAILIPKMSRGIVRTTFDASTVTTGWANGGVMTKGPLSIATAVASTSPELVDDPDESLELESPDADPPSPLPAVSEAELPDVETELPEFAPDAESTELPEAPDATPDVGFVERSPLEAPEGSAPLAPVPVAPDAVPGPPLDASVFELQWLEPRSTPKRVAPRPTRVTRFIASV